MCNCVVIRPGKRRKAERGCGELSQTTDRACVCLSSVCFLHQHRLSLPHSTILLPLLFTFKPTLHILGLMSTPVKSIPFTITGRGFHVLVYDVVIYFEPVFVSFLLVSLLCSRAQPNEMLLKSVFYWSPKPTKNFSLLFCGNSFFFLPGFKSAVLSTFEM